MDGSDAFPHQNIAAREYRDEFACPSLQSETSDSDLRNRTTHGGNEGLNALFSVASTSIIRGLPEYSPPGPSSPRLILSVFAYMDPSPFARRSFCEFALIEIAAIYPACY